MMNKVKRFKLLSAAIFAGIGLAIIKNSITPEVSYTQHLGSKIQNIKNNFPKNNFPKAYIVQSGSMEPTIKTGSIVISLPQSSYNQGDIITYRKDGGKTLVTHRINFKIYETGTSGTSKYITSGDANEDFDNWEVIDEYIVGKVILVLPYLGYVANFAKQPYGFILFVIVPATIIIYEELKLILKEILKFVKKKTIPEVSSSQHLGGVSLIIGPLIPIFGALFVFTGLASSFFNDVETSIGNILGAAQSFETPSPPPEVRAGDVVINEVYYDPDASHIQPSGADENNFEWIEIYNKSANTVNLKGWKIEDNSGIQRTISTSNRNLTPGQFAILAKAANVFTLWTIPDSAEKIPLGEKIGNGLANEGDRVVLKDSFGNIIDQMSYGTDTTILDPPSLDVAEGHSLERSPDGFDTDSGSDFVDTNPPTPGL